MVIWLLGLSGAGKTTLGKELKNYLKNKNKQVYLIDGDVVRDFYNNDLTYTEEDRRTNIKRILLATHVLEENDIIPIICNISPFEDLRDFARVKLNNYIEVYLFREINTIKNKDHVYKDTNVIGKDLNFDEPIKADITINTSNETIEKSLEQLINFLGL